MALECEEQAKEVRALIRNMSRENPLWGAPRIHGELLKLGIEIGETSVGKYGARPEATVTDLADFPGESPEDNGPISSQLIPLKSTGGSRESTCLIHMVF